MVAQQTFESPTSSIVPYSSSGRTMSSLTLMPRLSSPTVSEENEPSSYSGDRTGNQLSTISARGRSDTRTVHDPTKLARPLLCVCQTRSDTGSIKDGRSLGRRTRSVLKNDYPHTRIEADERTHVKRKFSLKKGEEVDFLSLVRAITSPSSTISQNDVSSCSPRNSEL